MKQRLRTSEARGGEPATQVALSHVSVMLEEAQSRAALLRGSGEAEALHDFRVAIRRLRTYIQAYRAYLPYGAKDLRRLKKVALLTNEARDAEVALTWVDNYLQQNRQRREPLSSLRQRLEQQKDAHYQQVYRRALKRWPKVQTRLHRRLGRHTGGSEVDYDRATGLILERYIEELEQWRSSTQEQWSLQSMHKTRIRIKRIRYLLEPLSRRIERGSALVEALKSGQDHLGELHDRHLLLNRLPEEFVALATARTMNHCERIIVRGETPERADSIRRSDHLPHQLHLLYTLHQQTDEQERWIRGDYLTHDLPQTIAQLRSTALNLAHKER